MLRVRLELPNLRLGRRVLVTRLGVIAVALAAVGATGYWVGGAEAHPLGQGLDTAAPAALLDYNTLRLYGYPVVSNPNEPAHANRPATAGSATTSDPNTGLIPEDPPYRSDMGPFDPLSREAPRMDFVTANPAWISERLGDATLRANWPGLTGIDEVSRDAHIRAGSVDASEKVWRRFWYEPQHLDKDLNADGRLTDRDNDGVPDAPMNPTATNVDEWYPAIMSEYTYMLVDNDPLPVPNPQPSELDRSAPRAVCGRAGQTQMVFPIGTAFSELDPNGPLQGYGLTRLDANFDGTIDMVNVTDEVQLPGQLNGTRIDFNGNGLQPMNPDGIPLSCDELAVFHTNAFQVPIGRPIQFLDHFIIVQSVTNSAAVVQVWYNGDVVPRLLQTRSVGIGAVVLAGENGPVQVIAPGGINAGVPTGPWFAYVEDADPNDNTAVLMVGRALGAPCASMEAGPNQANRVPGGPAYLKRFYVDGHQYNTVAINTCGTNSFNYITLRAPLPKVPTIIEQHSVRLQSYPVTTALPMPPPFNYEHTILEDVRGFNRFPNVEVPPNVVPPVINRPNTIYFGGPIGPVAPVLGRNEALPYTGRTPNMPVGPYNDVRASRWFYVDEATNPQAVGQLREKYGAVRPGSDQGLPGGQDSFFYNEQIFTLPWNFTEFVWPDYTDPQGQPQPYDPDKYYVTSAFTSPTARWRRWRMPNTGVPASIPPTPPDLIANFTPDGGYPLGNPRRAAFWFSPDTPAAAPVKLWTDSRGVRLFGGQPERPDFPCDPARPALWGTNNGAVAGAAAGDRRVTSDVTSIPVVGLANAYPVEILPYTDPWAPFNPQHPHAPPGDSITVNPAYMDEFRNFNEDLRYLYQQISNNEQNARQKVYHRLWYEPNYIDKIRDRDECDRDLRFLAMQQEFTYLYMDTTDNPNAATPGNSRFAFPIGTRANELPRPIPGNGLPANGGEFGYGLTTFDANFDDLPEAVTVHSENTLASYLDTQWQSHRPSTPGNPPPPIPGPRLDFDGDGILDNLDADTTPLNGNEMVVFAVESLVLDLDPNTDETDSAMILDHMVQLRNVTQGARAQFQFWFTGGNGTNARPEAVNGLRSLDIGDAAIVDRFQNTVTIVRPGQINPSTNGGWFAFVEDVASDSDRVTVTIGRALGATWSAIDDNNGGHDLLAGDPWYLKRFYVDGHEYNVVAVMTQDGGPGNVPNFEYITIRTPVPKGNYLNSQDTLFLQGYFLNGLPAQMSVMPPYNVPHTIAVDVERMSASDFANTRQYDPCVGSLAPAGPFVETIIAETREPRYGTELLEILERETTDRFTWQTDQTIVIPDTYTEVSLPRDQQYLYTSNWRSPVSRLHFYGCLRTTPPPFPSGVPSLTHAQVAALAAAWSPPAPANIIPAPNQLNPAQPAPPPFIPPGEPPIYAPYFDARLGGPSVRVKIFYDPQDNNDWYINRRTADIDPGGPTATPTNTPTGTVPTPTRTATPTATIPGGGPSPTPTNTVTPGGPGAPLLAQCQVVNQFQVQVTWTDNSTFETEFLVEISVNMAPFAPINPPIPSTSQATTGQVYNYTTPNLAANTGYRFRVQARNPGSGQSSPYSNLTGTCQTATMTGKAGCYKGKLSLQGRSDHGGTLIIMDGIPMTFTAYDGRWDLCGALPGEHTLRALGAGYLTLEGKVPMPEGSFVEMPYGNLPGGDVNTDTAVNLFDLVRVGADYRSSPPGDPEADINKDNAVNLFDLVLVGTNYGSSGPVPWGPVGASSHPAAAAQVDIASLRRTWRGDADASPLALSARPQQDGTLWVDVTARQIHGLYGADIRLAFDPTKVEILDSLDKPGLQVQPGQVWQEGGHSFIPLNKVDPKGQIVFSATRTNPAEPVNGDVVLASIHFRATDGGDGRGAIALTSAQVADKAGGVIPVRWEGVDVIPLIDVGSLIHKVFLPWLTRANQQ